MTPHTPWGARHGLVAGNPPLDGVGEWRKLARLDKTEELLVGNVGARPIRHCGSKLLGGLEAQAVTVLQIRKSSEPGGQVREEEEEDRKAKS
jgi:hypothetical protein